MLIILAGLPGVGKTTLAREVARATGAVHLRIDTIEQALRDARPDFGPMDDAGYRVAYAVAADNLRLGRLVIADSVNPVAATRTAWRAVAAGVPVASVEIEIVCADAGEHRRRVETRTLDLPGLVPPTWAEVRARDYEPWDRERIVVDTAGRSVDENVSAIRAVLAR
jgi:predicted kinase